MFGIKGKKLGLLLGTTLHQGRELLKNCCSLDLTSIINALEPHDANVNSNNHNDDDFLVTSIFYWFLQMRLKKNKARLRSGSYEEHRHPFLSGSDQHSRGSPRLGSHRYCDKKDPSASSWQNLWKWSENRILSMSCSAEQNKIINHAYLEKISQMSRDISLFIYHKRKHHFV